MTNKIRLHKYVNEYLKKNNIDFTNTDVQKNIQRFGVMIGQDYIFNRLEWIFMGEKIDISHWPKRDHGPFEEIKVLLYNTDFLLVFKPSGVVTESGAGHTDQNLVSFLQTNYGKKSEVFQPVHRLDKDTQGIILIAKNELAQTFMQDQFRRRQVSKKYLTVLNGKLDYRIRVTGWQSRNLNNPLKQIMFWKEEDAMKYSPLSRNTESIFTPISYCSELNQTFVEVEIKTGRMHQIRLQAEFIHFPIKAEKLYNKESKTEDLKQVERLEKINLAEMNQIQFTNLEKEIFGSSENYLLCNYLQFKDTNNSTISYKLKDLEIVDKPETITKLSELDQ